jgi:16S rRNA (adenine1518-N6/adenine1519-N6)-dimethyltransferase
MKEFKFKKKFGQNFITDVNIINKIIEAIDIDKETLVIEIGPGSGMLTKELCKKSGQVLAFEIDETLKPILETNLIEYKNIDIIFKDFLRVDISECLKNYNYKKLYLVANLPYYITTPIIVKVIEEIEIDKMCIMVQKEVGDRFSAKPKTKSYGSITVYLNYYFDIKEIMNVSRNVFIPKPNVDSAVILFSKKQQLFLTNKELFNRLVKDSFTQKRKTIKNNLKKYDLNLIEDVLKRNNLTLTSRAEEIPVSVFVEMANELAS